MVVLVLTFLMASGLWAESMPHSPSGSATQSAIDDLLFENSDFEAGDLSNWSATGDAFDFQPTKGDNHLARSHREPSERQGEYWIGTFESTTGNLNSVRVKSRATFPPVL